MRSKEISASQVELAIDCGSFSEYKDHKGIVYQKDQYFSNSKVADYSLNSEKNGVDLRFTKDQAIYFTERHQDFSFHYNLPVKNDGNYVIILKFTELYFDKRGQRQFNINIGERTVRDSVDIVKEVQKNSAFDLYLPFRLQQGQIHFQGQLCEGGYDKYKQTIKIEFEKIEGKDNPKVDGIMLVRGTLQDTDYYQIESSRQEWIQEEEKKRVVQEESKMKEEMARLKKKEKTRVRHDDIEEGEDEEEELEFNHQDWYQSYLEPENVLAVLFFIIVSCIVVANLSSISIDQLTQDDKRRKKKNKH